ncbi:MAG: DMT family transporter [Candidatus Kapaibacteriota bacterium]
MTHRQSIIYLLLTALLWSTGGLLIKSIDAHPFAIAGGRSIIAGVVLWVYLRKPNFTFSIAQLSGAFMYALTVILFVLANKMTSSANAILLQYTGPIWVALFSGVILKERVQTIDWLAIIMVIIGMSLFFMDELTISGMNGNIIAICSGFAFAGLAIALRMQKDDSPFESILLGNILTGVFGSYWIMESLPLSHGSIIGLLLLGIIQLGIPYILYAKAIQHVTALESILIPVLEPLMNPLWVFLVAGEIPGKGAFIGGAIVLLAIVFRSIMSPKRS